MADSAPDAKVEDVLSSVRRLVSGDVPRKERAPLPKGPGALVLTDAHRIKKDAMVRVASRSLEDRIAELEAAVDEGAEEFEPDGSEDQSLNVPDRIVYTRPPSSEEEAKMRGNTLRLSEIALIQTPVAPANDTDDIGDAMASPAFRHNKVADTGEPAEPTEPTEGAALAAKALFGDNGAPDDGPRIDPFEAAEAPMAENVPTLQPRRGEVTAFTNPDDVVDRIDARIEQSGQDAPLAPIGEVSEPDAADLPSDVTENMLRQDVETDGIETDDDFDAALNEAIQASVTTAVFDELAPDRPFADTSEPELEPEPVTETAHEAASIPDDDHLSHANEDDPADADPQDRIEDSAGAVESAVPGSILLSDENAMREMVGRMIREELQGELGERITRNVRKLVRREVKRALDSRDLV